MENNRLHHIPLAIRFPGCPSPPVHCYRLSPLLRVRPIAQAGHFLLAWSSREWTSSKGNWLLWHTLIHRLNSVNEVLGLKYATNNPRIRIRSFQLHCGPRMKAPMTMSVSQFASRHGMSCNCCTNHAAAYCF